MAAIIMKLLLLMKFFSSTLASTQSEKEKYLILFAHGLAQSCEGLGPWVTADLARIHEERDCQSPGLSSVHVDEMESIAETPPEGKFYGPNSEVYLERTAGPYFQQDQHPMCPSSYDSSYTGYSNGQQFRKRGGWDVDTTTATSYMAPGRKSDFGGSVVDPDADGNTVITFDEY